MTTWVLYTGPHVVTDANAPAVVKDRNNRVWRRVHDAMIATPRYNCSRAGARELAAVLLELTR